jgi:hypothetical protein
MVGSSFSDDFIFVKHPPVWLQPGWFFILKTTSLIHAG